MSNKINSWGFCGCTGSFQNLKSVPCRWRQQGLPNGWCLSTNFQWDTFQDLHMSLCGPYYRPLLDFMQMDPKYFLLLGFILILYTNLYLYSRSDRLCKQYDIFLMCNSGYRSLPTQVLNASTYIAVVVFRVGWGGRKKLSLLSFCLYLEHGNCNVSRNIVTASVYKEANFWSLHTEQ